MKPRRLASKCHRAIIRALNGAEAMDVTALARLTGVSAMTIHRDLTELTYGGFATRVHDGALRSPKRGTAHPFPLRKTQDPKAKHLLAKATARLIDDDESVILGNETTCDPVTGSLAGRDIAILALSSRTAVTLTEAPGVHVVVPGGAVETASLTMLASPVIDVVRDFRTDVAVLGTCAASVANGLTCISPSDAALRRNILQSAARAIFPATPRELMRSSVHKLNTLEDLTDLLTTSDIPEESLVDLHSSRVPITICDQHGPEVSGLEPQTTGPQPRTAELGASKAGRKKLRSDRMREDPNDRRAPKMRAQGSRLPEPCALAKMVRPGKQQVRVQ